MKKNSVDLCGSAAERRRRLHGSGIWASAAGETIRIPRTFHPPKQDSEFRLKDERNGGEQRRWTTNENCVHHSAAVGWMIRMCVGLLAVHYINMDNAGITETMLNVSHNGFHFECKIKLQGSMALNI